MNRKKIRKTIKDAYGKIVQTQGNDGCDSCCGADPEKYAKKVGYSQDDLKAVPEDSNLGLGCGNPIAFSKLQEGETVLDLGSGAGFDCFLAAARVGAKGKVIGVDMTPEMIEKATTIVQESGIENVEFRFGEIEKLPVDDNSIDVVISNCVINLSPDKRSVMREVYRVLKPGGRIAISDNALLQEIPAEFYEDIKAFVGCITGALTVEEYEGIAVSTGFKEVKITINGVSSCLDAYIYDLARTDDSRVLQAEKALGQSLMNIYIEGHK